MKNNKTHIILASNSPRRKQLLSLLDVKYDIVPPNVDEKGITINSIPSEYCQNLAKLKAESICNQYPKSLIIGADTIVVLNDKIIEKPTDKSEAIEMLEYLSGNTHQVYTGIALLCVEQNIDVVFYEKTDVSFNNLTESDINYYIENYAPYDKAGSYGIQDWGASFVKSINGCYYNVVGFPVSKFLQNLRKLVINITFLL
ncbi:MAG: septum formation protein Maf [Candidatus Marinimicrobia bacterium]|nr:septum formation protein Maf [Candidatus Neomarinimicrobiota bacterium]MBL7023273.1 septum formation protein Maf [Candidatus Neomarinimicrobiota bacterium]MBL7108867.1 septum formation protein Maf [Candidatus Neomarinimicrobiota bacterium]